MSDNIVSLEDRLKSAKQKVEEDRDTFKAQLLELLMDLHGMVDRGEVTGLLLVPFNAEATPIYPLVLPAVGASVFEAIGAAEVIKQELYHMALDDVD